MILKSPFRGAFSTKSKNAQSIFYNQQSKSQKQAVIS
ncbi:hypothetical protein HPSNT_07230 [Helicobacter pylori SNT49]|uniref:Uncharacterized protein n=1 Tax=Helicobacter pylori SNT49 TaxID=1055530 RepID=G2MFM1_HELPX|nr:hypothetical protein HPSNT_07230 [Helicobacter pylori SNT49]